jgi:hypothetical protein
VQRTLAAAGFPAPEPLAPPAPLARGIAVAETLLDEGGPADAHDPAVRRALAASLARLVALCRPMIALAALRENIMATRPGELWPTPHDGRFDFAATTAGAEWLDEIAASARGLRDRDAGDVVVGHTADGVARLSNASAWAATNARALPGGTGSAARSGDVRQEDRHRDYLRDGNRLGSIGAVPARVGRAVPPRMRRLPHPSTSGTSARACPSWFSGE